MILVINIFILSNNCLLTKSSGNLNTPATDLLALLYHGR